MTNEYLIRNLQNNGNDFDVNTTICESINLEEEKNICTCIDERLKD